MYKELLIGCGRNHTKQISFDDKKDWINLTTLDLNPEHNPDIVFLEIDPQDKESKLSLALINEFHRYLTVVPRVLVTTSNDALCLDSFRYGVFDYFIKPLESKDLRKSLFRLDKELSIVNFNSNNNFSHFLLPFSSM